jgi:hypothetical protein
LNLFLNTNIHDIQDYKKILSIVNTFVRKKTAQAVNRNSLPRRSSPVELTSAGAEAVSPRMPRVEATSLSLTGINPERFFPAEGPLVKIAPPSL